MQIHEFQAKSLLKTVPLEAVPFEVIASIEEIPYALKSLGKGPYLIKPQIHAPRPSIAAQDSEDIRSLVDQMLGKSYTGQIAHRVLITKHIPVVREQKLIWTLNERPVVAHKELHDFFEARDLTHMELVIGTTEEGKEILLDATLHVDDRALYRQHELLNFFDSSQLSSAELYAAHFGFSYKEYDGIIGLLASGEGLGRKMIGDVTKLGGSVSALISFKGEESYEILEGALKMLMKRSRSLFITLYPEMMNAEVWACWLSAALKNKKVSVVVRLMGERRDAARALFAKNARIELVNDAEDAARAAIIRAGLL